MEKIFIALTFKNEMVNGTQYTIRLFASIILLFVLIYGISSLELRTETPAVLIITFFLIPYLIAVSTYKRAKTLGFNRFFAFVTSIVIPLLLSGAFAFSTTYSKLEFSAAFSFLFTLPIILLILSSGTQSSPPPLLDKTTNEPE